MRAERAAVDAARRGGLQPGAAQVDRCWRGELPAGATVLDALRGERPAASAIADIDRRAARSASGAGGAPDARAARSRPRRALPRRCRSIRRRRGGCATQRPQAARAQAPPGGRRGTELLAVRGDDARARAAALRRGRLSSRISRSPLSLVRAMRWPLSSVRSERLRALRSCRRGWAALASSALRRAASACSAFSRRASRPRRGLVARTARRRRRRGGRAADRGRGRRRRHGRRSGNAGGGAGAAGCPCPGRRAAAAGRCTGSGHPCRAISIGPCAERHGERRRPAGPASSAEQRAKAFIAASVARAVSQADPP